MTDVVAQQVRVARDLPSVGRLTLVRIRVQDGQTGLKLSRRQCLHEVPELGRKLHADG